MEINLTKSFLKHIIKSDLYITDLEDIDPEQANGLNWILQNNANDLQLTFHIERFVLNE